MSARLSFPLALGALGAGTALALAGACGLPGGSSGATFSHASKFVVTGSHQALACADCHDPAKPSFALADGGVDCLHCHAQADVTPMHAGVGGFGYDDASCIGCHKDGKTPQFDHTFFPIAAGAPHQNLACADCHGATRAVADLQCITCHTHDPTTTNAAHTGVTGYSYDSPSCYGCHKDGRGGLPSNHDAELFPVTGTPHAAIACSQCHGATKALADLQCLGCHAKTDMATTHAAVPGSATGRLSNKTFANYQYVLAACMACHADGGYHLSQHPSASGTSMVSDHHRPFCLACHQTMRPASGVKPWGQDFKTFTCLDCHTNNSGGGGG
ncbi:hypothetical protein [Anaeromyxobacter diazotrophicus]|uniref:Cytochrome c family protein n=1 Tax=Anaeromyxobacter diazotrophicus TaxID=2590199 RepID=A0A7I9VR63_9BACT|nr:hypothetical protein [Anaeromyxobacter diazotrophicus]GEJ58569.1 hypothetical protein AMYX_33100 [Anaeromyxobacter diazotrophicus]